MKREEDELQLIKVEHALLKDVLKSKNEVADIKPVYELRYEYVVDSIENSLVRYEMARKASELAKLSPKLLPRYIEALEENIDRINNLAREIGADGLADLAKSVVEVAESGKKELGRYLEILEKLPKDLRGVFSRTVYYIAFSWNHSRGMENNLKLNLEGIWRKLNEIKHVVEKYEISRESMLEGAVISLSISDEVLDKYLETLERFGKMAESEDSPEIIDPYLVISQVPPVLKLIVSTASASTAYKYLETISKLKSLTAVTYFLKYTYYVIRNLGTITNSPGTETYRVREFLSDYFDSVSRYAEKINSLPDNKTIVEAAMEAAAHKKLDEFFAVYERRAGN